MKTLSEVKPRELLSNHIHIRLTDSDYNQIKARAEQVNLSMSDFMRRVSTPYWGRGEQLSVARPPGRGAWSAAGPAQNNRVE